MNLLSSKKGRIILFASLYLSEGAPIGFIWWALPTKLRMVNYPVDEITTLTSLLLIPWTVKFLWSPVIDSFRTPFWSLKSWIITFQALMGVTLLPLTLVPFESSLPFLIPLLLLHAFFAASQDAAIDALAIAHVPAEERGAINGWMQGGMLVGRSLFGGGAILAASLHQDWALIAALIVIIWFSSLLLVFSKEPAAHLTDARTIQKFLLQLKKAANNSATWWGLLFAATSGAAFESVGAVASPFLLDHGFKSGIIGYFFSFPAVAGMGFGAIIGGALADNIGHAQAVKIFLISISMIVILLGFVAFAGDAELLLYILLAILYIAIGLFTASSYSLLMGITDSKLGATQFSAYMAMTNVCEMWAGFTVGRLVVAYDYPFAFIVMGLVSLCTLLIVRKLHPR
ncbi:MAG: MFS transporter [Bacteroidetes bacterium]|nr:MAG: MFS transporter [Bacteroidota bacterium]